jgi:hypothetical protein
MEPEAIRLHALNAAVRSSIQGRDPVNVVTRAHYYAHYIRDGSDTINCPSYCDLREPAVPAPQPEDTPPGKQYGAGNPLLKG